MSADEPTPTEMRRDQVTPMLVNKRRRANADQPTPVAVGVASR